MNKVGEWLAQARDWMDERGKPAWIVLMVLAFIFVWPIGLAVLFYMIWSGRMGCGNRDWNKSWRKRSGHEGGATGNAAFDEYRDETLRRLEEERSAFVEFLEKLRRAKDKAEFDQFMNDRRTPTTDTPASA